MLQQGNSFKRRIQILIVISVTAVSALLTAFYVYEEQSFAQERAERTTSTIKKTFDHVIADIKHFYIYRSHAIAEFPQVKEMMRTHRTQAIYDTVSPTYSALKRENPYLEILQFHGSDGRSIVRMHRKNEFGDDIASKRPMLRATHATQKIHSGFEGGMQGVAYRIVTPIFDHSTYVGAIEFGVDTDYIVSKLNEIINTDAVMMIHQSQIAAADESHYQAGIGSYRYIHNDNVKAQLLKSFAKDNIAMKPRIIELEGRHYEINPIYLNNDGDKKIGAILCIQDVTGGYQDNADILMKSGIITATVILFFLTFFEYAFGRLMTKIRFQDEYIRTILNSQKNIIIVSDGKEILFSNQAFLNYFSVASLEDFKVHHRCICDFFETSDSENYLQPEMGKRTWTEHLVRYAGQEHKAKMTVDEKTSIFSVHAQMMQFEGNIRYVVVFTDITKLNELATIDTLTRVPNRFQFNKVFEYAVNVSRRSHKPFSLILYDIDHFKQINDQFGHLVGDEVLKSLSAFVRRNLRKTDILARWGGEEFVVLLPETDLESATRLAETLRMKIAEHPFLTQKTLTCSMGVAQYDMSESEDEMMHRIDENLYLAKERGRNCVVSIL